MDGLIRDNWNALGDTFETLIDGYSIDEELSHLISLLENPTCEVNLR